MQSKFKPSIPVDVVQRLLSYPARRARRLAAEAKQKNTASDSVSQAGPLAGNTTLPQEAEQLGE